MGLKKEFSSYERVSSRPLDSALAMRSDLVPTPTPLPTYSFPKRIEPITSDDDDLVLPSLKCGDASSGQGIGLKFERPCYR